MGETLRQAFAPASSAAQTALPPEFEYIRLNLQGRQILMALGERRFATEGDSTVVDEFWYSAQAEMLSLRNGRIHKVVGMTTEWRRNVSTPPTWDSLRRSPSHNPHSPSAITWTRNLDVMPGYRFEQVDRISTRPITAPAPPPAGMGTTQLDWFEDEVHSQDAQMRPWVYSQRFAVAGQRVVYSEQCITPELCFSIQVLR